MTLAFIYALYCSAYQMGAQYCPSWGNKCVLSQRVP